MLRLFAAALVLYGHSFAVAGLDQPRLFGGSAGMFGVAIFFATSGYLIAGSWHAEPRLIAYAWKRCLRILPALVPLAVVLALVAYLHLFDGNPRPDLDPSLWTLPVEARCYLLVAVLGLLGLLRRPAVAGSLYVFFVVLFTLASAPQVFSSIVTVGSWLTPKPGGFGIAATMHLTCFVGGALMRHVPRRRSLALMALAVLVFRSGYPGWVVAVPYLVVYVAESLTAQLRHDLSYGVYIWGWPLQQAVVLAGVSQVSSIFALSIALSIAVAFCSWQLVEKPALALKARRPALRRLARAY